MPEGLKKQVRVSRTSRAAFRQFIQGRLEGGASNAEVNRELAIVKRAFSLGVKEGRLTSKPHIPMLQENNIRSGFFEADAFAAVHRLLPEPVNAIAKFGFITGWRLREILGLQWRQVDFDGLTVTLDPGTTKNGEGRTFRMTENLRELLCSQSLQRAGGTGAGWVFHRHGKQVRDFRVVWAAACKQAGCPERLFHDLRRTAVRNLVRAGVPEIVAMRLTGHRTRSVFERYNIVSETDLIDAARSLDRLHATMQARTRDPV